jgi:hypothetical protein
MTTPRHRWLVASSVLLQRRLRQGRSDALHRQRNRVARATGLEAAEADRRAGEGAAAERAAETAGHARRD